jgi:hypothetical protein
MPRSSFVAPSSRMKRLRYGHQRKAVNMKRAWVMVRTVTFLLEKVSRNTLKDDTYPTAEDERVTYIGPERYFTLSA